MLTTAVTAVPLAASNESGKAGPLGLLVVLLLLAAVLLLGRSMLTHLRRVPASFEDPKAGADDRPAGGDAPAEAAPKDPAPTDPEER